MAFNPNDYLVKLKGKDYLEVKYRIVWFRDEWPAGTIESQHIEIGEDHAIFRATVTAIDKDGKVQGSATDYGSETKRDFGDFIEKASTKAIGRALAALGYGTAFAPELEEGERIVDSPVTPKQQQRPQAAQRPQDAPKQLNTNPDKGKVMARLHALANEAGLSHDDLRALVKAKAPVESMNDAPVDVLVDLGKRIAADPAPLKQWLAKQQELMPTEDALPNPDRFTS